MYYKMISGVNNNLAEFNNDEMLANRLTDIMNVGGSTTLCVIGHAKKNEFILVDVDQAESAIEVFWPKSDENDLRVAKTQIVFKDRKTTFYLFGHIWPYTSSYDDLEQIIDFRLRILQSKLYVKASKSKFYTMVGASISFERGLPIDRKGRFMDQWGLN